MKIRYGDLKNMISEATRTKTFEQFKKDWSGKNVFVRFEKPHSGIPVSLNRNQTYGDVWGVWGFHLKYSWPEKPSFLVSMQDVYVYRLVSGSRVFDTGAKYTESDFERDEKILRKNYGDDVDVPKHWRDSMIKHIVADYGDDYDVSSIVGPALEDLSPIKRLDAIISMMKTTKQRNFIYRKLGYDAVIDSSGIITRGVYAPAVAGVVLDTTKIQILDSYTQPRRCQEDE